MLNKKTQAGSLPANNTPLLKRFFLKSYSSAIAAIVILTVIFTISSDSFLSAYNIFNLSRTSAIYGFIGASQLILMVIGDMNLGIGGVGAMTTVVMGSALVDFGASPPVAIALCLITAALCGLIIGLMVVKLRLSPWIITLAMNFVFNGLAIGYTHGYPYAVPTSMTWVGRSKIFSWFSFLALMILIFVIVLYVMFQHTKFGRNILAVGGNRTAARLSGINVDGTIIACNILSCLFASIAAILWACRTGTVSPNTGADWMMYSIAVCAIGGIPLNGGSFTALGFYCGSWILTMVRNGLTMMNVDVYYEQVFLGIIILVAVSVESVRQRVAEKMK